MPVLKKREGDSIPNRPFEEAEPIVRRNGSTAKKPMQRATARQQHEAGELSLIGDLVAMAMRHEDEENALRDELKAAVLTGNREVVFQLSKRYCGMA